MCLLTGFVLVCWFTVRLLFAFFSFFLCILHFAFFEMSLPFFFLFCVFHILFSSGVCLPVYVCLRALPLCLSACLLRVPRAGRRAGRCLCRIVVGAALSPSPALRCGHGRACGSVGSTCFRRSCTLTTATTAHASDARYALGGPCAVCCFLTPITAIVGPSSSV